MCNYLDVFINHTTLPMNCVFEILRYVSPVNKNELVKKKEGLKKMNYDNAYKYQRDIMERVRVSIYDYRFNFYEHFSDSLTYDDIRDICHNNGLKYLKTNTMIYQIKNIGTIVKFYYPNFVRKFRGD